MVIIEKKWDGLRYVNGFNGKNLMLNVMNIKIILIYLLRWIICQNLPIIRFRIILY